MIFKKRVSVYLFVKPFSPQSRKERKGEINFSFLLRGQKGKSFRHPPGNYSAGGQSCFDQSRLSRD